MVSRRFIIAHFSSVEEADIKYCQRTDNYLIIMIKKGKAKKLSKKEKAKMEAEQAETLRIEMEKERLKKMEEDR